MKPITTIADDKRVVVTEKMISIFENGQTAMKDIINQPDYLSYTPLEIAYRWALPIRFTGSNIIGSNFPNFAISFEYMSAGRIFGGDKAIKINDALIEKKVEPNTFYFVEEGKGNTTHPLFIFFSCVKTRKLKNKH